MSVARPAGVAFCPRCGEAQPPEAHFCLRCGLDLGAIELPAASRSPAAPPTPPAALPAPPPAPPVAPAPPPTSATSPVPMAPAAAAAWESAVAAPSAVGRTASRAGWLAVAIGVLAFGGAAAALVVAQPGTGPLADWDRYLEDPASVSDDVPFDIELSARNTAAAATDPVWVVVDWRPADRAFDPDAVGRFVACVPADCHYRDDAGARTLVYWPGLAGGEIRPLVVRVAVTGLDPGTTLAYRVHTGTGPDEGSLAGGRRWSPDLEVVEP